MGLNSRLRPKLLNMIDNLKGRLQANFSYFWQLFFQLKDGKGKTWTQAHDPKVFFSCKLAAVKPFRLLKQLLSKSISLVEENQAIKAWSFFNFFLRDQIIQCRFYDTKLPIPNADFTIPNCSINFFQDQIILYQYQDCFLRPYLYQYS